MKKKTVLIIVGVLAGLVLLCALCGGGFILLFSSIMKEGYEVKETRLYDLCVASKTLDPVDYAEYFSTEYREDNDFVEARNITAKLFPSDYDCEEMKKVGIINTFLASESISINTENGVSTIEYTKNNVTIILKKEDGDYKIMEVKVLN